MHRRRSGSLVAIEVAYAFLSVDSRKVRTNPLRHRTKLCFARRDVMHSGKQLARAVPRGELFDDLAQVGNRDRVPCSTRRQRLRQSAPPLKFAFCSLKLTRRAKVCNAQSQKMNPQMD